jgi:phage terminase large subunit-like protein
MSLKSVLSELTAWEGNKSQLYQPYPKQVDFHQASDGFRERLFMAGNQLGKTLAGGMEVAYHATGVYPGWWKGRKFTRPVKIIAAGRTCETTRDVPQAMLMGEPGSFGTGCLQQGAILNPISGRGLTNALDSVTVRHVLGGVSTITFKQYAQERTSWEGYQADIIWFDEEPPADVYAEGVTRTNATKGMTFITFTPLQGHSDVVRQFYPSPKIASRSLTRMNIYEVDHYTDEERERIIASYPRHERAARAMGEPTLGSGKIFPLEEALFLEDAVSVPDHWYRLGGIDFGWDHPTACVNLAIDRDADCIHVTHAYRQVESTPVVHAAAMKAWGKEWMPWAWPHDGYKHDPASGLQLAESYTDQGIYMMPLHAQFENGSNGLEAGLMEMLDRMQTGRLKINRNLHEVLEEIRTYHRDEGKIVKLDDDLICAIRYAMMMQRFAIQFHRKTRIAETVGVYDPFNPPIDEGENLWSS